MVTYNLKATKKGFDPIESNRYTLRVEATKIEPHVKNEVVGERIEITFRIVGTEFENRKVWDNVYLPQTLWKARTILEAGKSSLAMSEKITANEIANALTGLEVSAYVESTRSDDDKPRVNISKYTPVGGDMPSLFQ